MKSHTAVAALLVAALAISVHADDQVDEAIVARIKMEAFQRSRIVETLSELTDVYGARRIVAAVDVPVSADLELALRLDLALAGDASAVTLPISAREFESIASQALST